MNGEGILSEEDIDYLTEMVTIGAGKAAVALRQMLPCSVGIKIAEMLVVPSRKLSSLKCSDGNVFSIRIRLLGDVPGEMFFVLTDEEKAKLVGLARDVAPWFEKSSEIDESILIEFANIMAGVYLNAIHDFCKLTIYPTVPDLAYDQLASIMNGIMAEKGGQNPVIVAKNEYIYENGTVVFHTFIVPSSRSINILKDSINNAREVLEINKS